MEIQVLPFIMTMLVGWWCFNLILRLDDILNSLFHAFRPLRSRSRALILPEQTRDRKPPLRLVAGPYLVQDSVRDRFRRRFYRRPDRS